MPEASKITVKLVAETGKVKKGFDDFGKWVKKQFGSVIRGAFERIGHKITDTMTAAIRGLGRVLRNAVQETAQLQTALAEVSTLGEFDMVKLRHGIEDVAMALGEDLVGATRAAYQAISAGIPEGEVIPFTEKAAKAAVAGIASTETAVDALTSVLNAFRLQTDQTEKVSDLFFKTIQLGKTRFSELATGIGRVAPLAAATNVSLEEMFGSLAELTKVGLRTEEAVVGLRGVITGLLKPTEEGARLLNEMGFNAKNMAEAFGDVGFIGVLERISELGIEGIKEIIPDIRGLNAALALLGTDAGKQASETIDKMKESAGATDKAFKKMASTWERAWARIKAVISTISTEILTPLAEVGAKIANAASDWFTGKEFQPSQEALKQWQAGMRDLMSKFSKGIIDAETFEKLWGLNEQLVQSPGERTISSLRMWATETTAKLLEIWNQVMKGEVTFGELIADWIGSFEGVAEALKEPAQAIGRLIAELIWEGVKGAGDWLLVQIEDFVGGIAFGAFDALRNDPGFSALRSTMGSAPGVPVIPISAFGGRGESVERESASGNVVNNFYFDAAGKSMTELGQEVVRAVERGQATSDAYLGSLP